MADRMMNFHSSILQVASIIKHKEQIKAKQKIQMEKKKRDRKANYTIRETDKLVDLIIQKKDVLLECKKNSADQWNDKREAWDDIVREFNINLGPDDIYRDAKTLRIKYESLKRDIKKKWNSILANKRNSKGELPKFTNAEKKIKDIITLPMEGYCDFDSIDVIDDNKSDDGDSNDSCLSNDNNIEDNSTFKQEEAITDEETSNFAYHNEITVESGKNMHEDPLVGSQLRQKNSKNNEEPAYKRMRGNLLLDSHHDQHSRIVIGGVSEEENLKSRLQIELLKEELEIKKLQKKLLEQELEHKKSINELEKAQLLLKIKAFKNDHELT